MTPETSAVDTHSKCKSEEVVNTSCRGLSAAALIAALQEQPEDSNVLAEIDRRTRLNKATELAVRYLLGSAEDSEDAFDGLAALCWKATADLSILPTMNEKGEGKSEYDCTREFVQDFVLDYFRGYEGKGEIQVLTAAILDKFRFIGRRVYSRVIDEIRRRTAAKNREPWRRRLEDSDSPLSDGQPGVESVLSGPQHAKATPYLEFLEPRAEKLTRTLGATGYEVLQSHIDVFPGAYEGNDQSMESALTQAIQRRRMVSAQQARRDKREFREAVRVKAREGNRELADLHDRISRGDDDRTIRIEWVTGTGRKSSFRFRIPVSSS